MSQLFVDICVCVVCMLWWLIRGCVRGCGQLIVDSGDSRFIWAEYENNDYSRLFPPRNSRDGVLVRPRLLGCR
jgi:hypothetical protein